MSKHVELNLYLHHDTPDGWLLSETGEEGTAKWYPKKFVDQGEAIKQHVPHRLKIYEFTFPTWLAEKEGLV